MAMKIEITDDNAGIGGWKSFNKLPKKQANIEVCIFGAMYESTYTPNSLDGIDFQIGKKLSQVSGEPTEGMSLEFATDMQKFYGNGWRYVGEKHKHSVKDKIVIMLKKHMSNLIKV